LRELASAGSSVPLTIAAYFANQSGQTLQDLAARLIASRSGEASKAL
jgi:hypothetical protein